MSFGAHSLASQASGEHQQVNAIAREAAMGHTGRVLRGVGQPAELIRAQGTSVGAQMVTVHVGVSWPADAIPAAGFSRRLPLKGRLQWGNAASTFSADVDCHNGAAYSVVASSVTFSVQMEDDGQPLDQRFAQAEVQAALVWGTRHGGSECTRTLDARTIADNAGETWPVPPWAHAVLIECITPDFFDAPDGDGAILLHGGPTILDDPSLLIYPAQAGAALFRGPGLALAESARFLSVLNTSGGVWTNVRPVFLLAL